jgi:hypothetical protein
MSGLCFNDFDNSIIFSSFEHQVRIMLVELSREFVAALLQTEEDQKMMSLPLWTFLSVTDEIYDAIC